MQLALEQHERKGGLIRLLTLHKFEQRLICVCTVYEFHVDSFQLTGMPLTLSVPVIFTVPVRLIYVPLK